MLTPTDADDGLTRLRTACVGRAADSHEMMSSRLRDLTAPDLIRLDDRARFTSWLRANPLGEPVDWLPAVRRGDLLGACTASMHPDGYLRERAVRRLADVEDSLAARFLAMRTVDHVEQVRHPAIVALQRRTAPEELTQVLGLLLRLRGRAHGAAALAGYLEQVNVSAVAAWPGLLYSARDFLVRRFAYETAVAGGILISGDVEAILAAETDQWSRRRLAQYWSALDPIAAKAQLLHSRYVEGRLTALWEIPDELFDRSDLERRMLDRSPRVREAARWRYRGADRDPAAFYRSRWEAGRLADSEVDRILAGLRETGQTLSEDEARTGISSNDPRTRLAALRLWPQPTPPKAVLLALLADPSRAVVKHAAKSLSTIPSVRYDDVREAVESELANQRRAAWLVRRQIGDWDRVRGDLHAMQDTDGELAESAKDDLLVWLERRAATTYTRPFPSERDAIQTLLETASLDRDTIDRIAFHAGLPRQPPAPSPKEPTGPRRAGRWLRFLTS